ncbi:MAG: hypothetical protein Fues2KO_26150 [Fuerstiella sp.]
MSSKELQTGHPPLPGTASNAETAGKGFYDRVYGEPGYASSEEAAQHHEFTALSRFVRDFGLESCECLEVGSGRGAFQNMVSRYTGVDVSESVARYYTKPFYTASAEQLPFDNHRFDALWSITVLEHVPNPEQALAEMRRVLRPGGMLYLRPAWNCRPWICEGIPVRPYRDLSLRQKLTKASLPVRDSLWFRAVQKLPVRLLRSLRFDHAKPIALKFRRLDPDYSRFWMADSDACCSLDPFDVIQWFRSRGDEVVSHPSWASAMLSRSEALIVRIGG